MHWEPSTVLRRCDRRTMSLFGSCNRNSGSRDETYKLDRTLEKNFRGMSREKVLLHSFKEP